MRKQNPLVVFLLTVVTFGIYSLFWFARTRGEMNRLGESVPTTWLYIIPFVNLYYLWKWSEGVEHVSNGSMSTVISFILQFFLGGIGMAIAQDTFNNVGEQQNVPLAPVQVPSYTPTAVTPASPEIAAPAAQDQNQNNAQI